MLHVKKSEFDFAGVHAEIERDRILTARREYREIKKGGGDVGKSILYALPIVIAVIFVVGKIVVANNYDWGVVGVTVYAAVIGAVLVESFYRISISRALASIEEKNPDMWKKDVSHTF